MLTDWNAFRFLEAKKPDWIDTWNIDVDYLSARTKDFPALGSEMGWYGTNFLRDLTTRTTAIAPPAIMSRKSYFGYFDIWGLKDAGVDVSVPGRRL